MTQPGRQAGKAALQSRRREGRRKDSFTMCDFPHLKARLAFFLPTSQSSLPDYFIF